MPGGRRDVPIADQRPGSIEYRSRNLNAADRVRSKSLSTVIEHRRPSVEEERDVFVNAPTARNACSPPASLHFAIVDAFVRSARHARMAEDSIRKNRPHVVDVCQVKERI
jgi:hypothetical protein